MSDADVDAMLAPTRVSSAEFRALRDAARAASSKDSEDWLFPLRLAAAVLFSDGRIRTAVQRKAVEYGCTIDPVGPWHIFDCRAVGHPMARLSNRQC